MFIPKSNTWTRPGNKIKPTYITVHETDNISHGADALHHARLQFKGNPRQASWHFSVDQGLTIYQSLPLDENCWACGDGSGVRSGNMTSISIELCVNSNGDFKKTKANGVELIRSLMSQLSIGIDRVVPHQKWSGKDCPSKILSTGWKEFIAQVAEKRLINGADPFSPPYPGHYLKLGSTGMDVKRIQKEVGTIVDGIFGPHTAAAVKSFQKAHRLVQDSIVGPATWQAMFS